LLCRRSQSSRFDRDLSLMNAGAGDVAPRVARRAAGAVRSIMSGATPAPSTQGSTRTRDPVKWLLARAMAGRDARWNHLRREARPRGQLGVGLVNAWQARRPGNGAARVAPYAGNRTLGRAGLGHR